MIILEIISLISFALATILLFVCLNSEDDGKSVIIYTILTISLFASGFICGGIAQHQKQKTKGIEYKLEKYNISYKYIVEEDKTDTILVIKRK